MSRPIEVSHPAATGMKTSRLCGNTICEHMTNLASLPPSGGRLHAVPIAWVGPSSFPLRAYVLV